MSKKQIGKKTIAPALVAMLMVFALLLSACNSDTGGGGITTSTAAGEATTQAPAQTTAAETTQADATEAPAATTQAPAETTAAADPDALPEPGDFSEPVALSWNGPGNMTEYETSELEAKIKEKYNIDITSLRINAADDEKLNVTLASGEIPDVMLRWNAYNFFDQGVTQAIDKSMIEKYMPKSVEVFNQYPGAWPSVTTVDGVVYAVPNIRVIDGIARLPTIRQDWLEKLGLKMPERIEEWGEIMRAFAEDDPDGNGQNDTFGTTIALSNGTINFYNFCPATFAAFGVEGHRWLRDDSGLLTYGAVADGSKEALKLIQSWHKAGYIDPDWMQDDNDARNAKLYAGKLGFLDMSLNPDYTSHEGLTNIYNLTKENNPEANWVQAPAPLGPGGKRGSSSDGLVFSWNVMFGANATKKQIARAMQFADDINMDPETMILVAYGIEGVQFDYNEQGLPVSRPDMYLQPRGNGAYGTAAIMTFDMAGVDMSPARLEAYEYANQFTGIRSEINESMIEQSKTEDDKIKIDTAEMKKHIDEFYIRAVLGEVDIDAEWDAFVQRWNDLGGARTTEIARTLPIVNPLTWK